MHIGRQLLQVDLEEIAARHGLDPIVPAEGKSAEEEEEGYYLQYPAELRRQAVAMSQYYRIYLLGELDSWSCGVVAGGDLRRNWWDVHVPPNIRISVENNKQRALHDAR